MLLLFLVRCCCCSCCVLPVVVAAAFPFMKAIPLPRFRQLLLPRPRGGLRRRGGRARRLRRGRRRPAGLPGPVRPVVRRRAGRLGRGRRVRPRRGARRLHQGLRVQGLHLGELVALVCAVVRRWQPWGEINLVGRAAQHSVSWSLKNYYEVRTWPWG